MVARTRGWIKTRDKPNAETYELKPYSAEVIQTLADQAEIDKQLEHTQQQLIARILGNHGSMQFFTTGVERVRTHGLQG
jgi:hypothetical protein